MSTGSTSAGRPKLDVDVVVDPFENGKICHDVPHGENWASIKNEMVGDFEDYLIQSDYVATFKQLPVSFSPYG